MNLTYFFCLGKELLGNIEFYAFSYLVNTKYACSHHFVKITFENKGPRKDVEYRHIFT